MKIPQPKHIEFYEWQLQVLEEEWLKYANSKMKILIQEKRLFVGRIWGIQESQGNVVLRFSSSSVPRIKQFYVLCLVGSGVPSKPEEWEFSYLKFRESTEPRLSSRNTEIRTVNYLKTEDEKWAFILVSGFDAELLQSISEKYLKHQQHPLIVIAETDPPIEYLENLKKFVHKHPDNVILNLDVTKDEDSWNPINIDNEQDIIKDVVNLIEQQTTTIIQGPPGTGKSYLAAKLCDYYLSIGQSICVTALTNQALIEIALQEGLRKPLEQGQVFKTNLSSDEAKVLPRLRAVDNLVPSGNELMLSTYYKLSQKHASLLEGSTRFDLLVIEEASQAYLATIAMFSTLAMKVLIIGDHKQLTPVVNRSDECKKIHPNIYSVINGLQTFAFNNSHVSYRLTKTRRLTSDASLLTGVYYDNTLQSISPLEGNTSFNSMYSNLFHPNGGVSIARLSSVSMNHSSETEVLKFISQIAHEVLFNNPKLEVALLTPYIKAESALYYQYSKLAHDFKRISISTIHKIQGLTTDVTFLYLPLTNPSFDLNDNLFNVATSRAKRGTLIISYDLIGLLSSVSNETRFFIQNSKDVSEMFKSVISNRNR